MRDMDCKSQLNDSKSDVNHDKFLTQLVKRSQIMMGGSLFQKMALSELNKTWCVHSVTWVIHVSINKIIVSLYGFWAICHTWHCKINHNFVPVNFYVITMISSRPY